ncbi:MAG: Calx-beta domain-containing protein, partial [Deltaproteobacteria bacterium]|nr:Calx-beta domain-containing protein [Deltaproteobacteria bacterium]
MASPIGVMMRSGAEYFAHEWSRAFSALCVISLASLGIGCSEPPDHADLNSSQALLTDASLLRPILECVTADGPGQYTAHFGYLNTVTDSVSVPVGANNKFTPSPLDRGQPVLFAPGRHVDVFTVAFNGSNLVWKLGPRTSTASSNSTRCPTNVAPTVTATATPSTAAVSADVLLTATATDDGLPAGSALAYAWSLVSGPGVVDFVSPNANSTSAFFRAAGSYVVRVTVSDSALTAFADVSVTVTAPSGPTVSVGNVTLAEGSTGLTTANFNVSLSLASDHEVTVAAQTVDGSAVAGCDYLRRGAVITFAPGQTVQTFSVPVFGDLVPEPDKQFFVQLGEAVGATLGQANATGLIIDDDEPNEAPSVPSSRSPAMGSSGLPAATTIAWTASDPESQPLTFDVQLGTAVTTNGQTWQPQCGATGAPVGRAFAASAYDDDTDRAFIFGGQTAAGPVADLRVLHNATTVGQGAFWQTIVPAGSALSARKFAVAAFDESAQALVIHGGCAGTCASSLADAKVVTGLSMGPAAWTALPASPVALREHAAAYDQVSHKLIVFGGIPEAASLPTNDVWVLNNVAGGGTPSWQPLAVAGTRPAARASAALAYDAAADRLYLFGGRSATGTVLSDVWVLNGAASRSGTPTWQKLNISGVGPAGRWGHSLSLEPVAGRLLVHGGSSAVVNNDSIGLKDSWLLNLNNAAAPTWTRVQAASEASPAQRLGHVAAYSANRNRLLVFGGVDSQASTTPQADLWSMGNAIGTLSTVSANAASAHFDASSLIDDTRYFWRVVARDNQGAENGGRLFDFRTGDPSLTVNDVSVVEDSASPLKAVFHLRLSAPSVHPVTVNYATEDGTATAGSDYVPTNGTATIVAGAWETTVEVTINSDFAIESDESFGLLLSQTSGASLIRSEAFATIVNDDSFMNAPPIASAGADRYLYALNTQLQGVARDDGQPIGASLSITWADVSPANAAAIDNPHDVHSNVRFPNPGTYVLRLTVSDGEFTSSDDVSFTVDGTAKPPLLVNAGPDVVTPSMQANVSGTVVNSAGFASVQWTVVSGPGTATITEPFIPATTVTFSAPGSYVLKLTATDGYSSASDEATIEVAPSNQPPQVDAGVDKRAFVRNASGRGKVVVDSDEWILSNQGFSPGVSGAEFAVNLANYFAPAGGGRFLDFQTGPQWPHGEELHAALALAGHSHEWSPSDGSGKDLESLLTYDGLFVGDLDAQYIDTLNAYVALGGNVFLTLGTGFYSPAEESSVWSSFLKRYGFEIDGTSTYGSSCAALAPSSQHFLFNSVSWLMFCGALPLNAVDAADPASRLFRFLNDVEPRGRMGVYQPTEGASVRLIGTVVDDQLPSGVMTHVWTQTSGPATANIEEPSELETIISFPQPGQYVFRLTASDGVESRFDEATVSVGAVSNEAPVVSAGSDVTIALPNNSVALAGVATDDGVPGTGLTYRWSSGTIPEKVIFADPTAPATTAIFPAPGVYRLQLAAFDGQERGLDDLVVTVLPSTGPNHSPDVEAGPAISVRLGANEIVDAFRTLGTSQRGWSSVSGNWHKVPSTEALRNGDVYRIADGGDGTLFQGVPIGEKTQLVDADLVDVDLELVMRTAPETNPDYAVVTVQFNYEANTSTARTVTSSPLAYTQGWGRYKVRLHVPRFTRWVNVFVESHINTGPVNDLEIDDVRLSFSGAAVSLDRAYVVDDGLPWGYLSQSWTATGPGQVSFSNPANVSPLAIFTQAGTYVLSLAATDGELESTDSVQVVVQPNNEAPVVNAGPDLNTRAPVLTAHLAGTVTDDLTPPNGLVLRWVQIAGPGTATFSAPQSLATDVTFSSPGQYTLQLIADDGERFGSDNTVVQVFEAFGPNAAPAVSAGPDIQLSWPQNLLTLVGRATDDGLPENGTLLPTWSVISGPAGVRFGNENGLSTSVVLPVAGTYILRLAVSDGEASSSDDVIVFVGFNGQNVPPSVNAGADVTVSPGTHVLLAGSALDDGLPSGELRYQWREVSGPTFVNVLGYDSAAAAVDLALEGDYVFELLVSDTLASAVDTVSVRVVADNQPPVISAGPDKQTEVPGAGKVVLAGSATDDGIPSDSLHFQWTQTSGFPASIAQPNALSTVVTFASAGTYTFRLVVGDGLASSQDDTTVIVLPGNLAPIIDAGPSQSVLLPSRTALLAGTIGDDGKPAGSTPVARWSLVSGPGPVAFANALAAVTTATFQEVGTYTLRLTAHDGQQSAFDDTQVVVSGQAATGAAPTVAFSSPLDLSVVTAPTNLEGSVTSSTLSAWRLEMRPTTPGAEWSTFATGSTPLSGVLAKFDPTLLENGIYDIRLAATDTAGRSAEALMQLLVKDQMKLGHVALTFDDLNVPMAGVPIQILRSYDSRNTQKGDFGHGWTLDVNRVRVYENAVLGKGFGAASTGGFLPRYCVQPARKLVVTVITPEGRMHEFEPTVSDACEYFSPPDFVTIGFAAKPGTNSKLELVSGGDVFVQPGESGGYELWSGSDGDFEPFDPRRYRLTLQDGRVLEFDQFDGFTSITDRNGNSLTFDAHGITHSSGKSITFERDEENRITGIVDPMGKRNAYQYDPDGNLTGFTDREGNETRFAYDSQRIHHLRDIIDARGVRAIRHDYDADGRLISTTDSLGHAISLSHDLDNRKETVIDRNGYTKTLWFDERGNVVREVDGEGHETLRTYNSLNNVLSETDGSGRTRQYEYDTRDNVTAEVDGLGHRTEHTYNGFGQVLTTTDPLGNVTTSTYSVQGNLLTQVGPRPGQTTSYLYDFLGNMRQMTDALGHVSNYAHDDQGNKTSETDALGRVTTYTYDANNRPLTEVRTRTTSAGTETLTTTHTYDGQGRETRVVQADGSQLNYTYDAVGNRVTSSDALGHVTTTTYDTNGRATRVTYQDGSFDETTYDNEGRAVARKDRAGQTTSSTFDKVGRLLRTTRPDGTYSESTYDGAGRVVASFQSGRGTTTFAYDAAGQQTSSTDASGAVVSTGYDVAGRKVSETNALGGVTQFTLDETGNATVVTNPGGSTRSSVFDFLGREVSQTDERGKTTTYTYDELGRLTAVTDPLLNVTRYAYDEVGNRIATTDAANHTTHYEYDRMGRETKRVLPDGAFEERTYDAAGNVASRKDFQGRVTTYAYDVNNRQTLRTYPDSTSVAFTYNVMGRRLTATNTAGATTYDYDNSQRLLRKTDPAGRKVEYTYDSAGRQETLTAKVGAEVFTTTYGYDGAGRMVGVTDPAGRAFTMSHNAQGMLATLVRPNGVQTSYTHDNRGRLTNIRTFKVAGDTTIASYAYTLGASGLRDAITEADGTVRAYAYDDVGRLVGEGVSGGSGPQYTKTFAYDAVSNRSSQVTTGAGAANVAYSYDERQRLLTENAQPYVWDVNGNQTQRPTGDAYEWDFEDRLVRVTKADGTVVQNTYDVDGVLVRTSVTPAGGGAAVVTDFVVDTHGGLSHIVAEVGGSGAVSAVYVRAGDMLLEELR